MLENQNLVLKSDFQKIAISHNNDFMTQRDKLEAFSKEIPSTTTLPTASNDSFLAACIPLMKNHRDRATSADVNKLARAIQDGMIQQNKYIVKIIREFEVVYNTFNSLDKDYIQQIVRSFNAAVKAHEKANQNISRLDQQQQDIEKGQKDIKGIIKTLEKMVSVLKDFKEKLEKLRHLVDVDVIFSDVEEHQKQLNSVIQLANKQKAHMEQLSQDVNTKMIQFDQKHSKDLAELKSDVEKNAQKIEKQHQIMLSMLNDATTQLREEMNQKFYLMLEEVCVASQKITWN